MMMPEDIKNDRDRRLVNHVLQDQFAGLKTPDSVMKYVEKRYPQIFVRTLDDAKPKKNKRKISIKRLAAIVTSATLGAAGILGLANSESAIREREISKAHDYFNTTVAPELMEKGDISQEELVSRYYDLQQLTSQELGLSRDCAAYALLDYYDSVDLDDELYEYLGYGDKTDFAIARDYVPDPQNIKIEDEIQAASSFDNMNEEEFRLAMESLQKQADDITVGGKDGR